MALESLQALWWLLLPVAAASGWYAASRHYRDPGSKGVRLDLNQAYFQGFNYLLNEQPDKAIDVFIRVLEVDSDTVETHLALGNLFRRRGEVDRAIRIHQNIMARPTLQPDQRYQALYELAQDYQRSGLLDRAEALYLDLLEAQRYVEPALKALLDIYEQEQEWDKAIRYARQLQAEAGSSMADAIAHYHCELASLAYQQGDARQARHYLRQALHHDDGSVRASLLLGELDLEAEDYKSALRNFSRIEEQDPRFRPQALPSQERCYRMLGRPDDFERYLKGLVQRHGVPAAMLKLVELVANREGEGPALGQLIDTLSDGQPTLKAAERMLQYMLESEAYRGHRELAEVHQLLIRLLRERAGYRCERCGFEGKSLHWQCPGCKRWHSLVPLHDAA